MYRPITVTHRTLLAVTLGTVLWWLGLTGPGSVVSPCFAASVPLVRIGIESGVESAEVRSSSDWSVGVHRSRLRPSRVDAGQSWSFQYESNPDRIVVLDENDRVRGSISDTLFVFPDLQDAFLEINGDRYRGELLLWPGADGLIIANVLDVESYLLGVVPLEIGAQTPERFEAVKAQAVAARSYTFSKLGKRAEQGYDLLDTVADQVYGGVGAEKDRCSDAVLQTRGVVAVHGDRPIYAYYSSTSGGHTASPDEVWGGEIDDLPYLQGRRNKTNRVEDSFCASSPYYKWEEIWSGEDFERMIDESLPRQVASWDRSKYGRLVDMKIAERSASKRVRRLALIFEGGTIQLEGDSIRWAIRRPDGGALRSTLLEKVGVKRNSGRATKVGIRGRGYGHGVGLCQFGAMGMSEVGYDYSQILRFYYRGVELRRFY